MRKKTHSLIVGSIKRHPDGFGFFIPDNKEHPDVYIPKHSMTGIMTADRVMIEVFPEGRGDRFRGEIVRILSRGSRRVVGPFTPINSEFGKIKDDGKAWGFDLRIKITDSMGAKSGQTVVAEIETYPEEGQIFSGKVIEILGNAGDPLNDIKRVLATANIPVEFSAATLTEAKSFNENPSEKDFKNRKDLRNKNLITIDGATAKDFDDAVYVETTPDGFLLYVAIADVSHYVQLHSAIDKDAYQRGTSVYFPNFVVPMLPEVLSNGLCSLNPHVPRLCLVAEMKISYTGEVSSSQFYEGVMESKARVTYGEAQEIIDGGHLEKFAHVKKEILRAADLAKILMKRRFQEGSLDLEIPETQVVVDPGGNTIDIIKSERLFAHRLIEEMMLAANVAVASYFSKSKIPAIFRIHESPNEEAIHALEKFMWNFGGKTNLRSGGLQKKLTKALAEFSGRPESQILNILTLRSMNQAKYHPNNVGHFGLGFENYTHFTSPIRRYPDLIVHRLLKKLVMPQSKYKLMDEDELGTAGTFLSGCEQRAVKAERQVISIKKARFISQYIGQEFDGVVSGVARFGIFVLLRQYDVDGLVKLENLGNEYFEFDADNLVLRSKKGTIFKIGDPVRIIITSTDIEAGQINFELIIPSGTKMSGRRMDSNKLTTNNSEKNGKANKAKGKSRQSQRPQSPSKSPVSAPVSKSPQSGGHSIPKSVPPSTRQSLISKLKEKLRNESTKNGKTDRKDSQKRGKTQNNSKRLRKTRLLSNSGKNKSR